MLGSTTLAGRVSLLLCALDTACRVSGIVIDGKGKSTASWAQQDRRSASKVDKAKHGWVEVKGHRRPPFHQDFSGGSATVPEGLILTDTRDVYYSAEITIGGQTFTASVDTGSSDTWIQSDTDIPNAQVVVPDQTLQYGIGGITGDIETNEVTFAGSTIPDQYYLRVPPDQNQGTHVMGYIGLGHSTLSAIYFAANQTPEAASLVQNIFLSNPSTPNFLTIQLGRIFDPWDATPGTLTIGAVIPGMEQVHQQPQLPVTLSTTGINQRWVSILDDDGITVNGKTISLQPTVVTGDNADPQGRLSVLFDTGYTFPQLPEYIVDAIYGDIPGAKKTFIGLVTTYHIPCNAEINMTMSFGGVVYPIHPLDMSIGLDIRNNTAPHKGLLCQATFQPIGPGNNEFDMIAGMAFLRNVYLLTNYGDFIDGDPGNIADPYIQMLGTTDTSTMHAEFLVQRAGLVVKGHHNHSSTPVLPMGTATQESPGDTAKPTSTNGAESLGRVLHRMLWILFAGMVVVSSLS